MFRKFSQFLCKTFKCKGSVQQQQQMCSQQVKQITLKINNKEIQVPKHTKLLDAINQAGESVPYICYHNDLKQSGGICRICVVADKKKPNQPIISCKTEVWEGMDIDTKSQFMKNLAQANTAMMFYQSAPQTSRYVQMIQKQVGLDNSPLKDIMYKNPKPEAQSLTKGAFMGNDSTSNIQKTQNICINCDRCIETCEYLEGIGVYGWVNDQKSGHTVGTYGPCINNECVNCGQCINRCPTGALNENYEIDSVVQALNDPTKLVVFQTAPAVRFGIGEEFGLKPGEKMLKEELVEGLKMLTKNNNVKVVDTNFTADLTILEEATELVGRLQEVLTKPDKAKTQQQQILPMMTSCSSAWVDYVEKFYPEYIHKFSSCKSPMQMLGATVKGYSAKQFKWDPKNIVNVGVMCCTCKKLEKSRKEMEVDGLRDVDHVVTTREISTLLKSRGIDISKLKGCDYDHPLGHGSGAGAIFCATGGVMEAALRTGYEVVTGKEVPFKSLNITPVRGMEGVKEAIIEIPETKPEFGFLKGAKLRIVVAHGLANAKVVMDKLRQCDKEGKPYPWDFIEVMACPGGCIGGGGQPKPTSLDIRMQRSRLIYEEDMKLPTRKSHDNPEVIELYKEFFGKPNSHKAHKYLHTHYHAQPPQYEKFTDISDKEQISQDLISLKFEKNRKDLIVEMLIAVADKYGWISDSAIVAISEHANVLPISVLSTASSYQYLSMKPVGENVIYMCQCQSCKVNGAEELQHKLEEKFGIKVGETTADGQVTLKKAAFLGWCVNDAPALMIKKKGQSKVIPVIGALKMNDLSEILNQTQEMPENKITIIPYKNMSYFNQIDLKEAVQKAQQLKTDGIVSQLEKSGLQGRGGAGFPTYIKWKSVAADKSEEKYVVANADEGLPCQFKDWVLMIDQKTRNNFIAGMCICAQTVGAKKAFIYLRFEYRNLVNALKESIKEVKGLNNAFADIKFDIRLGAGPYVAGEETALFESIEGKGPRPRRDRNYFPTQKGLFQKPTVINNVETFAAIPIIMLKGGDNWGKEQGVNGEKGVKLFGITGDVEKATIVEYPVGTEFEKILKQVKPKGKISAAEIGGATEKLTLPNEFSKPLGFKPKTLSGAGSVVLYNEHRDLKQAYLEKMEFMQEESCQQCVPCRDGSKLLTKALHDHIHKNIPLSSNVSLNQITDAIELTSLCAHGKVMGTLFKNIDEFLKNKK